MLLTLIFRFPLKFQFRWIFLACWKYSVNKNPYEVDAPLHWTKDLCSVHYTLDTQHHHMLLTATVQHIKTEVWHFSMATQTRVQSKHFTLYANCASLPVCVCVCLTNRKRQTNSISAALVHFYHSAHAFPMLLLLLSSSWFCPLQTRTKSAFVWITFSFV